MSQLKLRSNYSWLILSVVLPVVLTVTPAWSHKIKADGQVGAMIHFEPSDQPKAQESTQVWFALTKKGGKPIPLQSCRCQLQLWQGKQKITTPSLQAIDAEKYQDIPSATLLFPQPGAYLLKLSGQAATPEDFQPFRLEFNVVVATGASPAAIATAESVIGASPKIDQKAISLLNKQSVPPYWLLGPLAMAALVGSMVLWRNR